MSNLHSLTDVIRARAARRAAIQQQPSISSFNPIVVTACDQWEWDRQGPMRRRAA